MVRSRHLEVVTDGDPAQARQLVRDLERFHHVMMAMTTATERQETPPLRVFLTGSRRVFRKLGGKQDAAANFFSTSRGHYALVDQHGRGYRVALRTLLHEYVHHIVALGGGWPPSWYNEGLAEYMETTEFFDDGSYTLGKPLSYRPSRLTLTGWVPMRKVLEADRILDLQREDVDVYGQAWCFVHYALSTAERRDRLHRFLAARRAGRSVGAALEESFGIDASELDGILQVYVEKPVNYVRVPRDGQRAAPKVDERRLEPVEVQGRLADMLLALDGPLDDVMGMLRGALSSQPNDLRARVVLARARLSIAELDEAARLLEQAAVLGVRDPEMYALTGHLHRERAFLAKQHGDEFVMAAELLASRKAYRRAIRLDNRTAEAYHGLGKTYLIDDSGSKEAVVVLEEAAYLLPASTAVPLDLARVLIRRRRYDEALVPLRAVRASPHNSGARQNADALIDQVQKAKANAAEGTGGE